jgi:hypothetical protein
MHIYMEMSQGNSLCSYLKQTKMSSFQKQRTGRQNRPYLGVGTSGRGEDIRKGCRRVNMVEYYALMYENGKMRPVETVPGMGGVKDSDGGVNPTLKYCKNFSK